jgi:hypothetical protein
MQRTIGHYFGPYRSLYPGSDDLLYVASTSDEDVPMVSRISRAGAASGHFPKTHHQQAVSGAVVNVVCQDDDGVSAGSKRGRFEAEAEESSALDDDDDQDSDDSFVVPDHSSECRSASSDRVPVAVQLRALCVKLRNRRHCVQCAQCLRFMRAISVFVTEITTAMCSIDDT